MDACRTKRLYTTCGTRVTIFELRWIAVHPRVPTLSQKHELLCTLAFGLYLNRNKASLGPGPKQTQWTHFWRAPESCIDSKKLNFGKPPGPNVSYFAIGRQPKTWKNSNKLNFTQFLSKKLNLTNFRSGWVAGREIHFTNEKWIPSMNRIRHGLGNPQLTQSPILHTIEIIIRATFCWKNLTPAQYILKNWSIYSSECSPQTC